MDQQPVDRQDFDKSLAERHKPLLVLYPEIDAPERKKRENWRALGLPPTFQDYHPRDIRLTLDHAGLPRRSGWRQRPRWPQDADKLMEILHEQPRRRFIHLVRNAGPGDRDKYWAHYSRIARQTELDGTDRYPCTTYSNVVHGHDPTVGNDPDSRLPYDRLIAIEYWFFYLYNDWKSTHEGDWELVIVLLSDDSSQKDPKPIACGYSAHYGGYRQGWSAVQKADGDSELDENGTHPVVYVAHGSHANYFSGPDLFLTSTDVFGPRVTFGEFPFTGEFVDFTTSFHSGIKVLPKIEYIPPKPEGGWQDPLKWLNFKGTWGSPGVPSAIRRLPVIRKLARAVAGLLWGPPASLPERANWTNPFFWVNHECDDPPQPSWLLGQMGD